MDSFLILIGKLVGCISRLLNRGSGSTWPGHIALSSKKNFIQTVLQKNPQLKIVLIVGTNGKTTTSKLLVTILQKAGKRVFQNNSGANLLNGLSSSIIMHCSLTGRLAYDYVVFEVDENNLPAVLSEITPEAIVVLNLFRDQLDRYGELDTIARKWKNSFEQIKYPIELILNADDALVSYLGQQTPMHVSYFGLETKDMTQKVLSHAADSIYCPRCSERLVFKKIAYSHLGDWECKNCGLRRPQEKFKFQITNFKLPGMYNEYNALAAAAAAKVLGLHGDAILEGLTSFEPSFGRQEKLTIHGKKVQIFLAKNPTGFNESLRTIAELGAHRVMFILNDRIPDGQDVSWIWDMDIEEYIGGFKHITVSGDRVYDMALRLKYAQKDIKKTQEKVLALESLPEAIHASLTILPKDETLYVLPTYSAMLDVRKILTGRKIG